MTDVPALTRGSGSKMVVESHAARQARYVLIRVLVYGALMLWAVVCLFPIYWTVTTSFKTGVDVIRGHIRAWLDFSPHWIGCRASIGLSPDTIFSISNPRAQFLDRFENSVVISLGASLLALALGSCAAYGLSRFRYKFGPMKNQDILFFFISQLILPPVVLALPFLILYKQLALLDSQIGMVFIYTLTVLPIVIWVMRDQFNSIPIELDKEQRRSTGFRLGEHSCASYFRSLFQAPSPRLSCRLS